MSWEAFGTHISWFMMFWIFGDIEIFDNFAEFLQILSTLKRPPTPVEPGLFRPEIWDVFPIYKNPISLLFGFIFVHSGSSSQCCSPIRTSRNCDNSLHLLKMTWRRREGIRVGRRTGNGGCGISYQNERCVEVVAYTWWWCALSASSIKSFHYLETIYTHAFFIRKEFIRKYI